MVTLGYIIENKRKEIEFEKRLESLEELKEKIKFLPPTRDFLEAISKKGINIIAETKVKPAVGNRINQKSMFELSQEYESTNVAVISVLTDNNFNGSKEEMYKIKNHTTKPIFRKDFILDEYQIYQSRAYGADAILLMSAVLKKNQIRKFVDLSHSLGMECLVEYSNSENQKEIPENVKVYGRNYRKLVLETDLSSKNIYDDPIKASSYVNNLPKDSIIVAESQITTENISPLKNEFDAFLVGTTIAESKNIPKTIEKLLSA